MYTSNNSQLKVRWFEKHGNKLGEESITPLSAEEIHHLLSLNSGKYTIKGVVQHIPKEKAHLLQPFLNHQFNFEKHTYFLGYYS